MNEHIEEFEGGVVKHLSKSELLSEKLGRIELELLGDISSEKKILLEEEKENIEEQLKNIPEVA